ncbi:MAG: bifunctional riboflavin kinase/FAD synthetase [Myxococcales bacterium]|nr:bifunctional riboflavin kinase/FAD synthetase [Myxococcales bacterium]
MKLIRHLKTSPERFERSVVTIGNFDGVHLGHQRIFHRLIERARALDATSVAYTFDPHPLKILNPEAAPKILTPLDKKAKLIAQLGVDVLVCERFTEEFAAQSPEDFVREVLVERLRARHVFVGYDYRFGKGRAGNIDLLRDLGERWGFAVDVTEAYSVDGEIVGSTLIRRLVSEGRVREAARFLGRTFFFRGRVVHGKERGKKMGIPTANLVTETEVLPSNGVYAVYVDLDGRRYHGAMNVGVNPTFGDAAGRQLEVFVLNYEGDLYGKSLRVHFVERIREERKFPNPEALVAQIRRDVDQIRDILQREDARSDTLSYGPGD